MRLDRHDTLYIRLSPQCEWQVVVNMILLFVLKTLQPTSGYHLLPCRLIKNYLRLLIIPIQIYFHVLTVWFPIILCRLPQKHLVGLHHLRILRF